jgi:methyltransferase (TIGR00027 family)
LDTFAYRNPFGALRVFEVDHPSTQAWKRDILSRAGIAAPDSLTFVAVDFDRQTAFDGLAAAGFDRERASWFTWLGVTMYLQVETVHSVLRTIASLPHGSGVVFDYAVDPAELGFLARRAVAAMAERVASVGEPWTTFFKPATLAADLRQFGFTQIEDLSGDAMNARYFSNRPDGLRVGSVGRVVCASV